MAVSVHEVLFDLLGQPVCCMFMNKNDKFVNSFIGKISAYYLMYKFNLLDCFSLDIFEKNQWIQTFLSLMIKNSIRSFILGPKHFSFQSDKTKLL